MNCGNRELLIEHCREKLDRETAADLERHMETCGTCRNLREEYLAAWRALDLWEAPPIAADFDYRLYQRLDAETSSAWWRRLLAPFLWRPALPLAAAAALVIAGILLQRPVANPPAEPQPTIEVEQVERTLEDMEMLQQFSLVARKEVEPNRSM